jgi:hypothetical protein
LHHRLFLASALLVGATAVTAVAQTPPAPAAPAASAMTPATPPMRVRGKVAALTGNALTVDSRDGQKLEIALADNAMVASVKRVELSEVGPSTFIGTATRPGADGKLIALEVLVFPEAMRGTGEGFYPWDLEPGSMMTNGTVKGAVTATSGRELTVTYKDKPSNMDKSHTVDVPPGTPVVTFAPATRDDLKPGAPVFVIATKNAEGKLTAARVTVGKDGVAPPM